LKDSLDEGATLEKNRKSEIARRPGNSATARQEFDQLTQGMPVRGYPNGTRAATLADGTEVTVRKSSDGRTTIELAAASGSAAILFGQDELGLVAGSPVFVRTVLGMPVEQALREFAEYAEDMREAARHLPEIAARYGGGTLANGQQDPSV